MKKKKWLFLLIPLLAALALALMLQKGLSLSSGRCLLAENGTVLLVTEGGEPIVLSNTRKRENLFSGLSTGDKILVLHDGVEETYPARTGAYALWKQADGSLADIPADTLRQLEEMGWQFAASVVLSGRLEVSPLSTVWANWTDANLLYMSCLNTDKMSISSVQHLPIFKAESRAELDAFRARFEGVLDFDQGYDEVPSFQQVTAEMDEAYFAENTLFLVYVPAGSGSYRFAVDSVYLDETAICIHVKQTNDPEVGTCNMAGWLLPVTVNKASADRLTVFDADLNNLP